jgi:hypothetical protein
MGGRAFSPAGLAIRSRSFVRFCAAKKTDVRYTSSLETCRSSENVLAQKRLIQIIVKLVP